MSEEFTPRELGLLTGAEWARHSSAEQIAEVAETEAVSDGVRELVLRGGMADRLSEFDDAPEGKFWAGFIHGVRAFMVEDLARVAKNN